MLKIERPTADTPIGVAWRGERGKLVVTGIDEGSPSAKAGISIGDVVLSINGSAVTSGATAGELVKSAGARVEIVVVRPAMSPCLPIMGPCVPCVYGEAA